jgi:protein SCO1/2
MRKSEWWQWGVPLVIFLAASIWGYQLLKPKPELPVYNPADVFEDLVPEDLRHVGRNHRVANYHLTDQWGEPFALNDHADQVVVANFFFTTCPSICIDMAKHFRDLQSHWKDRPVVLVSHSVMPEVDTGTTLLRYAEAQGTLPGKWYLLTGSKDSIYHLARRAYFAVKDGEPVADDHDFIHTENVILLDTRRRIRGFYDGTSAAEMERLKADVEILLNP